MLFERHRIYLDLVRRSLPFLPADPRWHAYPGSWEHLDVVVLDVADVCVSKLKRWTGSDRQDVSEMIARAALDHPRFVERFTSMVDRNQFDARADSLLPLMVERLHEVERDLFALDEVTPIHLPGWITD